MAFNRSSQHGLNLSSSSMKATRSPSDLTTPSRTLSALSPSSICRSMERTRDPLISDWRSKRRRRRRSRRRRRRRKRKEEGRGNDCNHWCFKAGKNTSGRRKRKNTNVSQRYEEPAHHTIQPQANAAHKIYAQSIMTRKESRKKGGEKRE